MPDNQPQAAAQQQGWKYSYNYVAQSANNYYYALPENFTLDNLFSLGQPGGITYAKPEPLSPEQLAAQEQQELQRARRMEALYRQARLKKQEELLREKQEEAEDGVLTNKFLIGCDPEFVAVDAGGHVINVQHTLPHLGEVGWDHSGNVIEVRPKPAKGAFALVRRIQKLLKDPRFAAIGCSKLRAGAYVAPYLLGGHIHIGLQDGLSLNNPARITALDAVTKLLEHLDILPAKECEERRKIGKANHYGEFGSIRVKDDGHFEYRTMASWMHDPRVAYICLTAAKLAAIDPTGTTGALAKATSFAAFETWMENYRKDDNAVRALRVLGRGHKALVKDPTEDLRGRWETLGL